MKYLHKIVKHKFFIFLVLIIVIVGCFAIFVVIKNTNTTTQKKNNSGAKNIFGYNFKSYADINGNDTYFEYIDSDRDIQLTIFYVGNSNVARLFIGDHMTMFKSIFEPKRVDYPGQYTKTIECPPEYKPKYFERNISQNTSDNYGGGTNNTKSDSFVYFLGYANSNKVAGACSDDLIAYRHIYGMLNCESLHKIVKVEYFTNITSNSTDEFIDRVSCKGI
jgi:hypothetical protein